MKCLRVLAVFSLMATITNTQTNSSREHGNPFEAYYRNSVDHEMGLGTSARIPMTSLREKSDERVRQKRMLYGSLFSDPKNSYLTFPAIRYFVTISHAHQCTLRMAERFFNDKFTQKGVILAGPFNAHCVHPYDNPRCGGSMVAPRVVLTACHCLATFWKFDNASLTFNPKEKGVWEDHNLIFRPGNNDKILVEPDSVWWKKHMAEYLGTTSLSYTTFELFMLSRKYYVHDKCKHINKKVFSYDFGFIFLSKEFMNIPDYVRKTPVPAPNFAINQKYIFAPIITEQTAQEAWLKVQRHQTTCLMMGTGWDTWYGGSYQTLPPPGLMKYTWRTVSSYIFCSYWLKEKFHVDPWNLTFWQKEVDCDEGYKDCCTWDCTLQTGRIPGVPAPGDDGAPVVCDGLLYAIIGASYPPDALPLSEVVFIHANVFNVQMYAELRPSLLMMEAGLRPGGTDALPPESFNKPFNQFYASLTPDYSSRFKRNASSKFQKTTSSSPNPAIPSFIFAVTTSTLRLLF